MGYLASWIGYSGISLITSKIFPGSWYRTGGALDQPKCKCHRFSFSSWKAFKFVCLFVFSYLTFIIHTAIHSDFQSPSSPDTIWRNVLYFTHLGSSRVFPGGTSIKNLPANAGDLGDLYSIPGSGRSPGGGHGIPLQYSCLENPVDRGAWQAIVHGVTKSWTWLKQLSIHACRHI